MSTPPGEHQGSGLACHCNLSRGQNGSLRQPSWGWPLEKANTLLCGCWPLLRSRAGVPSSPSSNRPKSRRV